MKIVNAMSVIVLVLANLAFLGTCAKMYWYDHLPLPAIIATVVILAPVLNILVVRAMRRALQKVDKGPDSK